MTLFKRDVEKTIPAIDQAETVTETATFALG